MRGIPVDILRAFVAVVEARGFTRAADELSRTQPTISLQVKRLEELVEAPLFKKDSRFELSAVGEVCFAYGKRLLRVHDDMLEEVAVHTKPSGALRIGLPSELSPVLAPRLGQPQAAQTAFDIVVDNSSSLSVAFRQGLLDVALVIGADENEPRIVRQWRGRLRWFGGQARPNNKPLALVVAPQGCMLRQAATEALRAQARKFEVVCTSADFTVLGAAASAGLGVTPLIDGPTPERLKPSVDVTLPDLPEIGILLLARSRRLASTSRFWIESLVEPLQAVRP
jgi:DNA-binding transcriptional LysR family regulator